MVITSSSATEEPPFNSSTSISPVASALAVIVLLVLLASIFDAAPRFRHVPLDSAYNWTFPSIKLASSAIGTTTLIPVLVEFHLLATTLPPVAVTEPT